jgi:hypothetical protein
VREPFRREHDALHGPAIRAEAAASEVIERHAVLRAAAGVFDLERASTDEATACRP